MMEPFARADPRSLPTAKPFVGRTMVVRIDPNCAESDTLVEDVLFMRRIGVRPIVVHDAVDRSAGAHLIGRFNRVGGQAVGIDGTAASMLVVAPADDGDAIIRGVNTQLPALLLDEGYIPVVAAEGVRVSGAAVPISVDDAAGALAAAMHAVRLLISSEPGGVPLGDDGVIAELTSSEALALASGGTLSKELAAHLVAAARTVRAGVDAAQILDLAAAHAALVEMLTAQHIGTQIVSGVYPSDS